MSDVRLNVKKSCEPEKKRTVNKSISRGHNKRTAKRTNRTQMFVQLEEITTGHASQRNMSEQSIIRNGLTAPRKRLEMQIGQFGAISKETMLQKTVNVSTMPPFVHQFQFFGNPTGKSTLWVKENVVQKVYPSHHCFPVNKTLLCKPTFNNRNVLPR